MKTSIALIGFMGSGKSVVGRALAASLGRDFVELDDLVEGREGRSIADIFREDGERRFRELEAAAVGEVAGRGDAVIACGGGVILNQGNIDRLKKDCIIIYLTAPPETIMRRLKEDRGQRPLLAVADRETRVREMMASRRPLYEGAADVTIDTSGLTVEEVVKKIQKIMKEVSEK